MRMILCKRGEWVLGLSLPILLLRYNWTFHEYVTRLLDVPRGDVPGRDDSPFYFLRVDAVDGICAGIGFALSLVLAALTWKRYRNESIMVLFMGWICCLPSFVNAIIIVSGTSHLMNAKTAVSSWKTFDEWFRFRQAAFWGTLLAALPFCYVLRRRYGSQASKDTDCAPLAGSASSAG
jgi:hypothetical protein